MATCTILRDHGPHKFISGRKAEWCEGRNALTRAMVEARLHESRRAAEYDGAWDVADVMGVLDELGLTRTLR